MHKKTSVHVMIFFSVLLLISFFNPVVVGDGGVWVWDANHWKLSEQENQMGIIDYDDGVENLTLVIRVSSVTLLTDKVMWVFPVPANPEDIDVKILSDIQFFDGEDVENMAHEILSDAFMFMLSSQLSLSTSALVYFYVGGSLGVGAADVTIYEHEEKMGLTTELIETKNSTSFAAYLKEKNLTLGTEANSIIDEYLGQDYAFVVSWVSDLETFLTEATQYDQYYILGVSISFPTDKIYYPLKLTSVYDNQMIPIFIQIQGFVTPDKNVLQDLHVDYKLDNEVEYTEVTITTPANEFTNDLWFAHTAPANLAQHRFIASYGIWLLLLIYFFISCLASMLSGLIIYRKYKPIIPRFAALGLFNIGGFFGMFISSFVLNIDQTFVKQPLEKPKIISKEWKQIKTVLWMSFWLVLALIIIIFVLFEPTVLFMWFTLISLLGPIFFAIIVTYGLIKDKRKTYFVLLSSLFFIMFVIITMVYLLIMI